MAEQTDIPKGFEPANFTPGFLDHGGPYYLGSVRPREVSDAPRVVALRVMSHHINYRDNAHGGVLTTLADVALSHAVYDAERPQLAVSTISLATNFLQPVRLGDWLECAVSIDRMGGRTAYCSGSIRRDGDAVATMNGAFNIRRPGK